ncbi:MAG: hypothetical protein AAB640_01230 [Patescibacteria group bacterium]
MSSTKIINVLKDDSFQEIIDIFKATSAEEVIFVLPKSARAFKKEEQFASLREEAKTLDKSVSFLCSSLEINDLAKKYRFEVLLAHSASLGQARSPEVRKKSNPSRLTPTETSSIDVVNEIEDFYAEPATSDDSISISQPTKTEEVFVDDRRLDDIFVPEVKHQHNIKVAGTREKALPVQVNQDNKEHKIRRPTHRTVLIFLTCATVVILGAVIFITAGKARITIKPVSQPLDLSLTIFTSDDVSSTSLANMAIPGQLFNIQKTVSQDFTATGRVDVAQKARGAITVYNELSTDQPLIATTRFESADRHIFHTLTSIVVPAGKISSGKFVPGSKEVQLIADKAGSEYNVPAGPFTIPAFKEQGAAEKYQKVYGRSTAPILNGTSGQSTIVTETDLSAARQTLTTQLTANIQDELETQINGLKIINDRQIVVSNPVSTSPVDAKTATFQVNLSGSLKTVGFKESDLNALVAQYVDTQKNMTTLPDKLVLTYDKTKWDDTKNGLSFTIHVTGPSYTKIDQQKIITDLLGKNDAEMRAYLGAVTGISSAHVSLSPFWVKSIPSNRDKVQVELSY